MPDDEYEGIPKGLFDWLVSTDERVNAVHKELLGVAQGVATVQNMVAALAVGEEVAVPGRVTRQVKFEETLGPLQGIEVEDRCPLTGEITSITIHWPDGCNGLLHIAVGHNGTWLCPHEPDTFLALNDATPTFPMKEPVVWDERLWAIIYSGDGREPHKVSVIITIIGTEEWA